MNTRTRGPTTMVDSFSHVDTLPAFWQTSNPRIFSPFSPLSASSLHQNTPSATMDSGSFLSVNNRSIPSSSAGLGKRVLDVSIEGREGNHLKRLRAAYETFTTLNTKTHTPSMGSKQPPSILPLELKPRPSNLVIHNMGDARVRPEDVIDEVLFEIISDDDKAAFNLRAPLKSQPDTTTGRSVPDDVEFSIYELHTLFSGLDSDGDLTNTHSEPVPSFFADSQNISASTLPPSKIVLSTTTTPPSPPVIVPVALDVLSAAALLPNSPRPQLQPRSWSNMAGSRNLRHPLSPASRDTVIACSDLTLAQTSSVPTVVALTSFPFRITSVNPAFCHMTNRRPHHLIGASFFDLFVQESNYSPCMATCSTLEGVFSNDIVRVKAYHRRQTFPVEPLSLNHLLFGPSRDIFDDDEDSLNGPNDGTTEEDGRGVFCQIQVQGVPQTGSPSYFSIRLSPLHVDETMYSRGGGATNSGIVYLPMPAMPR